MKVKTLKIIDRKLEFKEPICPDCNKSDEVTYSASAMSTLGLPTGKYCIRCNISFIQETNEILIVEEIE